MFGSINKFNAGFAGAILLVIALVLGWMAGSLVEAGLASLAVAYVSAGVIWVGLAVWFGYMVVTEN